MIEKQHIMLKLLFKITLLASPLAGFASYVPVQNPELFHQEPKFEDQPHPYICWGVGSIMIGLQGGIFQQFDSQGYDLRIGAGTIFFASGAGAHVNYLRFPEIGGKRDYYFGTGVSACYHTSLNLQDNGFFGGPNLVLGKKVVNEKGNIRIYDINLMFPVDRKGGNWCIPTASVGWMF
jgi:hypothetical protein